MTFSLKSEHPLKMDIETTSFITLLRPSFSILCCCLGTTSIDMKRSQGGAKQKINQEPGVAF